MNHLIIAHPGHELLLHGWISRTRPVVHVLTDGSGHHSAGRLGATRELLRDLGAHPGTIFGRLSDREAYAMILEGNTPLLLSLATELAAQLETQRPAMVVCDAAEGYNPVHDLCRLVAGAAIAMADIDTTQYEYPVVEHPRFFGASMTVELTATEHAAKIARARGQANALADIDEMFARHGENAYRTEAFRRIADWTSIDDDTLPLYERYGEERVAAHRYAHVIRRREHMTPLRDTLCAGVNKRSCAF
jgi:hypothetical protein